ncbi:histidinol-phosphate transaminase [Umezakia ovalisporum]|jgi:histidinol-phosphate aminotransferase|uniref:Histidinol-phosphate aminotransferase n=3 Tax=Umezakia ovalisporum TaxID=75695 RepID=A0AA43GZV4_9CYAN|nr:histidinol-phosphate transaminase [Umezakia ovalisporum]MBI1243298.1 histidinol-phosphate transaminase [Nostoc sp. RI_552]MDH6058190.1 histidinol-phosphate transaminase [Umezakia ovalisporum FSS-43]MDH6064085.1 histidinol-phosphate transaminase [Umezakia ovalisporum FSS-62]MDH6069191.1 histidinol-phosphate transaminase [Umezakia ovalisporum APH033B]MDH6071752.1 histidinol-phosphate transaminase [Umezakia ovalisporum CobakiLakeA]
MNKYFRSNIHAMASYIPGEQPQPGVEMIKLNSNENPYPPSPGVLAVLRNIEGEWLRRYPEPLGGEFRRGVREVLGVPTDWIIVGNGSDEILNLVMRACTEPGKKVVYPIPTYVLYMTLTQMQAAELVEIPYGVDYKLPLSELIAANGAVTFIASPNSPSGHIVPISDLRTLASCLSGVLVIDEAYVDFAEDNALALVKEYDNVIVIRTLSKGYSLAGLRLGFGVANPQLLDGLFKVKDSYNIDAIACALGTAAITDQVYKNACVAKIKASRTQLATDLKQLGFHVWDSNTNFLLVQPPQENAQYLYQQLKERQILVRYFPHPGLDNKLRITVGTDAQNQVLVERLKEICF